MKVNGLLDVSEESLEAFCRKWKIQEFALFGSVLREEFRPDSDVDVLVSFEPDAEWDLFDVVDMQDELAAILAEKWTFWTARLWSRAGTLSGGGAY